MEVSNVDRQMCISLVISVYAFPSLRQASTLPSALSQDH
jgi:hypothetical protein